MKGDVDMFFFSFVYNASMNNPWERAQEQLRTATSRLSLDPLLAARLEHPDRVVEGSIPLRVVDEDEEWGR